MARHHLIETSRLKETIPTADLRPGMFVESLDRPWLETPFLLQGFLIENDEQLTLLRQHCASAIVDFARSSGEFQRFRQRPLTSDAKLPIERQFPVVDAAEPRDFLTIYQLLQTRSPKRYQQAPTLSPVDGQSRLEAELLYSAPIVDDIKKTLESICTSLDTVHDGKLAEITPLVGELAEAVKRNADALLWLTRLKSTDQYSYDHAVDVSVHLMMFGRFLNLPEEKIQQLGFAGIMQDVGKIRIPQEILNKPDRLTEDEYDLVQSHVASSLSMLEGQPGITAAVLDIVAGHHERHDGSGYPRRLADEKIPLGAELAGMIDVYCAMTRKRSYNTAVSHQRALESLLATRGQQFREPLVDQFIQCMGLYPVGTLVEMNTGEVAVVIQQNKVRRLQPRVLVVLAADKSVERYPATLDLMMHPQTPDGENYRIRRSLPPDAYGIDPAELYLV
ncbi:MAG TPA: HD-GYP domain-containing protein [Rhodocyclaceae bacterium]|nr:HD-GYP domain-containing protein [Rhodocyclaceae bacterium]